MFKYFLSLLLTFLFIGALIFLPTDQVPIAFHQKFIEGVYQESENTILDLENVDEVFGYVFSALDPEVTIYPTENYYYFILRANGKSIWGNINLGVDERDKGFVNFAYWESRPDAFVPGETLSLYKKFGPADGVIVKKISDFRYSVVYNGKEVFLNLNQIEQTPPKLFTLGGDELFVQRTLDESGFGFFLIFNKSRPHLMFVLDEERNVPDKLKVFDNNLLVGEKSGFAFYDDKENNRKILMGIYIENMKQNNYYDGPFDQLADNYIQGENFQDILERVYPQLKGTIDNRGVFTDYEGARVAITPYYSYLSVDWLYDTIKECGKYYTGSRFYNCITHDQKEEFED